MSDDRRWLFLRGDAELESDLRRVQTAGERSASEVDSLARDLRNSIEIQLCLHQETARGQGADLLSASHPLIRAALKANQRRTRYGSARIQAAVTPGSYLVLISVAAWNGFGPAAELWTAACGPSGRPAEDDVGAALLTALAEAEIEPAKSQPPHWNHEHVGTCMHQLLMKKTREQRRRENDNAALVEGRRISLRNSHKRKVAGLHQRIDTAKRAGNTDVRLFESQLRLQQRRLDEAERELQKRRDGALSLEHVALCSLEVVAREVPR